ncbi:hypothetical protein [Caballeronia sp. LZ034LL]|nr:hypothetical protein [Caballeronia sp. LZ034LL]MDR5835809.1 hypothetical protein [Caballeronia sp. LZ034LL]
MDASVEDERGLRVLVCVPGNISSMILQTVLVIQSYEMTKDRLNSALMTV